MIWHTKTDLDDAINWRQSHWRKTIVLFSPALADSTGKNRESVIFCVGGCTAVTPNTHQYCRERLNTLPSVAYLRSFTVSVLILFSIRVSFKKCPGSLVQMKR